jgi:hypothetical protein
MCMANRNAGLDDCDVANRRNIYDDKDRLAQTEEIFFLLEPGLGVEI